MVECPSAAADRYFSGLMDGADFLVDLHESVAEAAGLDLEFCSFDSDGRMTCEDYVVNVDDPLLTETVEAAICIKWTESWDWDKRDEEGREILRSQMDSLRFSLAAKKFNPQLDVRWEQGDGTLQYFFNLHEPDRLAVSMRDAESMMEVIQSLGGDFDDDN
jgi:hypothetical protein